jgi:transcriptional regulator with XRE-family HTH domain
MPRKKAPSSITAIDVHVGRRLRARRLELKMSQADLADGFGLTFQQIQKYEKGTNRMGASRLAQAARILEVTPSYFFENASPRSATQNDEGVVQVTRFLADGMAMDLARAFQRIEAKDTRRAIANLVAELVGTAD